MEILDYITIAVFAAGIMFVGSLFSSTSKNMKSFFAGGGNVPWWISGLSLFMGFFSAGTFVVWGSIAYSMGFVAVTIQLTMAAAGFAVGLLIAPRWNKTGCLTAAEYITRRYGASTQKLYTYIFLFISIFTTGSFLYPIAKIIEVAAGIPLSSSILILGVFCMIYVSLGGLRAVVVTDVLQFIILFAAVIIVIPLAFGEGAASRSSSHGFRRDSSRSSRENTTGCSSSRSCSTTSSFWAETGLTSSDIRACARPETRKRSACCSACCIPSVRSCGCCRR